MARQPRLYMEGCAQHIVQRGVNRQACFFSEQDYAFYLQQLKIAADRRLDMTPTLKKIQNRRNIKQKISVNRNRLNIWKTCLLRDGMKKDELT